MTRILPVDPAKAVHFIFKKASSDPNSGSEAEFVDFQNDWDLRLQDGSEDASNLQVAAELIRKTDVPVAFPTETVYGLGADATRSEAVRGIYKAKQRPADNPLIVHVCSLAQLRSLLRPRRKESHDSNERSGSGLVADGHQSPIQLDGSRQEDTETYGPIPAIYRPLIQRFWPGPLTILLPNPSNSQLVPEVTAGLSTFGARMPRSTLALALIKLAGVPLAAPSANASTRPSPTTADHVKEDLDSRIDVIIDGGPCPVGVESTVVDGLSNPPAVLRPGGISLAQLRRCEGWENVVVAYKDGPQTLTGRPKAPGMKYRHYSPRAKVMLCEPEAGFPSLEVIRAHASQGRSIGFIRTKTWKPYHRSRPVHELDGPPPSSFGSVSDAVTGHPGKVNQLASLAMPRSHQIVLDLGPADEDQISVWDISLGENTEDIARGIFSALRDLDRKSVDVIFVEGIRDDGDLAAAIMNRLRKAAG